MSQTPSPEQRMPSSEQPDIDQGLITSQVPPVEQRMFFSEQLDIGPGGIIVTNSPDNRELLERIERTRALSPIELYILAVSYQQSVPNSGLGNRLGFIGLSTTFQNIERFVPEFFPQNDNTSSQTSYSSAADQINFSIESLKWKPKPCSPVCCNLSPWLQNWIHCNEGCVCATVFRTFVKSVPYIGLELLIEGTQADERITYTILGVSPSDLEPR